MRSRTLLLVLATALVVAFALLNWSEFIRAVPLSLGWTTVTAPLGLILLGLLAITSIGFLASSGISHARHVQHEREQTKALQAQRDLADRAESSRFVDLRQTLDTHLKETQARENRLAGELDQTLIRSQRELRTLLEQMHRSLTMHLGEMEARLDSRLSSQVTKTTADDTREMTAERTQAAHSTTQDPANAPRHTVRST